MPIKSPDRVHLAQLPTPLVRLRRLERELDASQIWMKRDDLTGLELSGNKVRKLEYVAADAIASGCDTLITEGTSQSNHCRATAAVCAKLGLKSHLLFRPAPAGMPLGNHLLDELFGAKISSYTREQFRRREEIYRKVVAETERGGGRARVTPMGASEPLGCWGYIRAMAELAEQLRHAGVDECDVVVAISSGGTYAGALLGKLLHRLDHVRLWAVPVSDDVAHHAREVGRLCRAAIEEFSLPMSFDEAELRFIDGHAGAGYAVPHEAANRTLRLLARVEGIVLDPVYTAKAFWAMLDEIQAGRLAAERPVVFIHTGGVFSNFAWPETVLGDLAVADRDAR